jgi:AcrR family transcriptional regulator
MNVDGSQWARRAFVYAAVFVSDEDDPTPPRSTRRKQAARKAVAQTRSAQRSRLIDAIVEIVADTGYPETKVGDIARAARVSRATFYELFRNKEECFVAAHRDRADRLLAEAETAVAGAEPERATDAVFATLVGAAVREPPTFSLLTHEAMLAGPLALDERDRLMARLEEFVEQAHGRAERGSPVPDAPSRTLLGGLIRVVGMRMRVGHQDYARLHEELIKWVDAYRVGGDDRERWSLTPNEALMKVDERKGRGVSSPVPLPRGRHRLPAATVRRVQRERVLHATAEVIRIKGYANTTVADIVAQAGVSREVFYSEFSSRRDAFVETHRLVFEQTMAAAAGAFFTSTGGWPDRVWDGWKALTDYTLSAPSFAHFGLMESYALGPEIARRTDDAVLAFTVFLREGQDDGPQAARPSQSALDAIAGAALETAAFFVRQDRSNEMMGVLPLTTYVTLAPFVGTTAAREFVERKVAEWG